MYSHEYLGRFYFQYQTEVVSHGMSLQSFCLKNNVPYNIFHKWYKDTPQKNSGSSVGCFSLVSNLGVRAVFSFRGKPFKEGQSFFPCRAQIPEAVQSPECASRAYILDLILSNGLHILKKDLDWVCTV